MQPQTIRKCSLKKTTLSTVWTAILLVGVILALVGCKSPELAPATTDVPPIIPESTIEAVTPTETESPTPTETDEPSFSIFGTWTPDGDTTTVLVNQPPAGMFCSPDASMWMPQIIIEPTGDATVARVYGLHEHLEYQDLPLEQDGTRIVDNFFMPDINQTLVLILQLEQDGRLYHEEQNLVGEDVYCSASVFYISAGD